MRGRLHTRYAPVRRSSPEYCYPALPLDLHVLSLPLAFILSQDQTLHCKNCFVLPFDSSSCRIHIYICMPTHAISFFSSVSNNTRFFSTAVFSAKADAKIQPFSNMPKYFFRKMRFGVPILLSYSVVHRQKIFVASGFRSRKTVLHGAKKEENPFLAAGIGHQKGKSAICRYGSIGYLHTLAPRSASYQQSIPQGASKEQRRNYALVPYRLRRGADGGDMGCCSRLGGV